MNCCHHKKQGYIYAKHIFLTMFFLFLSLSLHADQGKINLLFLGDQGHHKPLERFPYLKKALSPKGVEFTYTENVDDLNYETLKRYDGLILYANIKVISPSQESALINYVESGGGFIPLHCASFCFRNSDKFVKLVGAQFKRHGRGIFTVPFFNKTHEVTKGLKEFETWDETYVHVKHNEEGRTVLQYRKEGDLREPWTWVREQGRGRVFYTAYGHDHRTWSNPGFHNLVYRGILWAIGKGVVNQSNLMNEE